MKKKSKLFLDSLEEKVRRSIVKKPDCDFHEGFNLALNAVLAQIEIQKADVFTPELSLDGFIKILKK